MAADRPRPAVVPPRLEALTVEDLREALRLLGHDQPAGNRAVALRRLKETLTRYGTVRTALERAPEGARSAFVRLVQDGPATVDTLLGRGWWGHGSLPPPLDWLQRRAFVAVDGDAWVHAVRQARDGYLSMTLDLAGTSEPDGRGGEDAGDALRVERCGCVLVAGSAAALDRALTVGGAGLRAVAPMVAVSAKSDSAVLAALRAAGMRLSEDMVVSAEARAPALPGSGEEAVGPRMIRTLLRRGVDERRQLRLQYFASSRGGAATERVVDPWSFRDDLLRGYCHLRSGERTFAVDRIGRARLLPTPIEHVEG